MVIIRVNGGLGNQLQQYALYEKFKSLGKEVKLDLGWFEKHITNNVKRDLELVMFPKVSFQECTAGEVNSILGKRGMLKKVSEKLKITKKPVYVENMMYDENIFLLDNIILEGYWACERYYSDIMDELREKLEFPPLPNERNIKVAEEILNCNSVSIHLRRGDYLTKENQAMFGGICTDIYYGNAIDFIREGVEKPVFYIFSDDPSYAAKRYQGNEYKIVDINRGKNSLYDIYLMSQCKHNICANSTFSFWGARLNCNRDKMMVRPLKQKNCDWYEPEIMKELWKGWFLFDEKGIMV